MSNTTDAREMEVARVARQSANDANHSIIRQLAEVAESEIHKFKAERTKAYWERDQLICALSKLLPSHLTRHQPEDDANWENDWKWIVVMYAAGSQLTWHIHDSELSMFDHLKRDVKFTWDGHTTKEKYKRLEKLIVPNKGKL